MFINMSITQQTTKPFLSSKAVGTGRGRIPPPPFRLVVDRSVNTIPIRGLDHNHHIIISLLNFLIILRLCLVVHFAFFASFCKLVDFMSNKNIMVS